MSTEYDETFPDMGNMSDQELKDLISQLTEEEHEVTLKAERPVVTTETDAVERVRLGKETVASTETVSGEVRKEQVELVDDPTGTGTGTGKS